MDSRLLNVFHDDPFDGAYVEYEHDPSDLWSDETTRSLDLQLTETLNGILPIAASDTVEEIYSDHRKDDALFHNNNNVDSKNALIFAEQQFNGERRGRNEIQIIRIDPNVIDDSDSDEDGSDSDADGRLSQLSGATFRTRTDSSSIGDYESHSSDYDEDDDDEPENGRQEGVEEVLPAATEASQLFANITNLGDELTGIIASDDFLPLPTTGKSRTYSTNTICSDVDGLGLHIDANNFDLAEFITKDDFTFTAPTTQAATATPAAPATASQTMSAVTPTVRVNSLQHDDSDSDSDVIVDVETVEFDAEEEAEFQKLKRNTAAHFQPHFYEEQGDDDEMDDDEVPFVDNVKKDPIWNPKQDKKAEATHKEQKTTSTTTANKHTISKNAATTNTTTTTSKMTAATSTQTAAAPKAKKNTFSLVPSKKQSDLLRGKLAGKNKSTARAQKLPSKHPPPAETNPVTHPRPAATIPKLGVGQGGKNLSLIAQQLKQAELSSDDNATPKKQPIVEQTPPQATVKRKLNLEEYKQRRNGHVAATGEASGRSEEIDSSRHSKVARVEGNPMRGEAKPSTPSKADASKHSPAVTAIVKSLKQKESTATMGGVGASADPITVARNKVLRMQQLKKAQQLKIIDSTISAKVPRVTKLLPLKEIVRDTCYYAAADTDETLRPEDTLKSHPDYEEIIIVSTSCNTEVSLPPHEPEHTADPVAAGHKVNVSRSLLKSSTLLYNITNNLKTKKASEAAQMPTNSLIASIQDVVVKKTAGPANAESKPAAKEAKEVATNGAHHGEDKIIMHLRKDRIRRPTAEMATQTDLHPDFPTLPLKLLAGGGDSFQSGRKSRKRERQRRRCYRKRTGGRTSDEAFSDSDSSATDSDSYASGRRSYRSRSPADGYASSAERLRLAGDANTNGGYSSRSSRRHRSSVSSSYSESDRLATASATLQQRQRHGKLAMSSQRARRYSSRSSSTSSMSDYSEAGSRGRTRSRSPYGRRSRTPPAADNRRRNNSYHKNNNVSQPAVEERRIVYVGRIEQETTKEMLRRKFLPYGNIKQITIHYKDTGMKYGFVTYDRSQDAFTVIDTGPRDPTINMYDISFGGRRAFCRATYADLDNAGINTYHSYVYPKIAPPPKEEDSFEALLLKVKAKMNATKPGPANNNNQSDETGKI